MGWETHPQPPTQLSPSPTPGRLTALWVPTERADRQAPIHRAWVSFGRPSTCLLRGLGGKGNSFSNSGEQGGSDCVMQMINSNLWRFWSIPGLTRKNQENSNLKKGRGRGREYRSIYSLQQRWARLGKFARVSYIISGQGQNWVEVQNLTLSWKLTALWSFAISISFRRAVFHEQGTSLWHEEDCVQASDPLLPWLSPLFPETRREPTRNYDSNRTRDSGDVFIFLHIVKAFLCQIFYFEKYIKSTEKLQKTLQRTPVHSSPGVTNYFCYICFISLYIRYTIGIFLMNYESKFRLLPLNISIFATSIKDSLLNNYSTIIKFRKFNIVKLLLSNLQFIFKFH